MDRRLPLLVLLSGSELPLQEQTRLRAGPLSLVFEAGGLRYVRLGAHEVWRGIYVAVRDANWLTIPPVLSDVRLESDAASFRLSFDVAHEQSPIDFYWRGSIEGDERGRVTFTMRGEARSTFRRNRIGFCVLHPADVSGAACVIEHTDGTKVESRFPFDISPHQPFKDIRAIEHQVGRGVRARVEFEGDTFEMEDQRNWTDASFKIYCTPLESPLPVEVEKGTKIFQKVTLTLLAAERTRNDTFRRTPSDPVFAVHRTPRAPLPRIGLCVASHGQRFSSTQIERLKRLRLSHLRVDLTLSEQDFEPVLRRASAEAESLGVTLEVALHLSDSAPEELARLSGVLDAAKPPVSSWLVFRLGKNVTPAACVDLARENLGARYPAAKIGFGTNANFTELNRERPSHESPDLICYSLNPQVHAFDNASLIETLKMQAVTLGSARAFACGAGLAVTPITLKPRFLPSATEPLAATPPGELPISVDPRQMSLFGAAWTVGSFKYLCEEAAASLTYYETTGWLGVMEREAGSPLPEKFRSLPGAVFPLYHVLADAGEFAGGEVLATESSDASCVDGFALREGGRTRVVLANMTAEPRRVAVHNLAGRVRVKHLDDTNAESAMRLPEEFRQQPGRGVQTDDGRLGLTLAPYGIIRIDEEQTNI